MKKLILIILSAGLLATPVFANIYADFNGAYTQTGDLENMPGLGGTLAVSLHRNVNLFARTIYSTVTKDANTPEEIEYSYWMMLGGLQYISRIQESRVYWFVNLALGTADGEAEASFSDAHAGETGPACALWAGLLVEATQRIAAYIEAGYHYPMYENELKDADIKGFQVLLGVRFTIWGRNRSLFGDY